MRECAGVIEMGDKILKAYFSCERRNDLVCSHLANGKLSKLFRIIIFLSRLHFNFDGKEGSSHNRNQSYKRYFASNIS